MTPTNPKPPSNPRWSEQDTATLLAGWGRTPIREIARSIGRSYHAVRDMAGRLGLKRCSLPRFESVAQAAERTGFEHYAVTRIIAMYSVPSETFASDNPITYVDPDALDAAIAKWMSLTPVNCAARALGMDAGALRRRLARAGIKRPTEDRIWRVSDEDIARAMMPRPSPHPSLETTSDAAIRTGLTFNQLWSALRGRRVPMRCYFNPRKTAYVDPEAVDAAIVEWRAHVAAKKSIRLLSGAARRASNPRKSRAKARALEAA